MATALHADTESELVNRLRQLFVRAKDSRASKRDTWMRNLRLVHNRMNTTGIQSWQPSPRASEIYPTISSIVAWMMDNNINVDCIPAADPHSEYYDFQSQLANDLSAVIYTNWMVEGWVEAVKMVIWDAAIYGLGIVKTIWDQEKSGGIGNAMLVRVDPWAFYVDPQSTSKQDMQYCVEARMMSLDEIERRYPNSRMLLEASGSGVDVALDEKPQVNTEQSRTPFANAGQIPSSGTIGGTLGASTVGRFGRPSGRKMNAGEDKGIAVYEYWLRENEIWYDDFSDLPSIDDRPEEEKHVTSRWRVIVMAKGEILMDEFADELWNHGEHPYEFFKFDDVGEFYGISLVDHLAYPQIYINRILSMLQQNTELCGNPIFIEPSNSGTSRVPIINRPGQRLTISGVQAMNNRPDWLKPPDMPSLAMELVQFWITRIENISGLSALQKGKAPNQRNAESVINQTNEAAFVRVRSAISNLERTLESAVNKAADLIIDNYDTKRIMAIVGPDGEKTAGYFLAHHFMMPSSDGMVPLKYIVQIRAGSTTPTSRSARIAESDKLYGFGVIDDQAVLEAHQYPHIKELLARKYEKQQKGLIGGGGPASRQRSQRSSR